jgi:F0F1-type ATP synthase epsilon subunit
MNFTMISSHNKTVLKVAWIEINTPVGNFVMQRGHIPTILPICPHKPLTVCLANGKQETFHPSGGVIDVNRESALLVLSE